MLRLCTQNRSNVRISAACPGSPDSERIPTLKENGELDSTEDARNKKYIKYRYMNSRAIGNQAYIPTEFEHIANMITHGIWVIPSLAGTMFMLQQSHSKKQYIAALVYGLSLVALFTISTTFHSVFYMGKFRLLKEVLHVCDRAAIYIFIAASYTPWLLLKDIKPGLGSQLCWLVWFVAIMGIVYQYYFHERFKHLETIFYLCIGVLPSIAIFNMQDNKNGLYELIAGGAIYITGVLFFKLDGRIPCAHAIWHLFVNAGASCHFYAVCKYLMSDSNFKPPENYKTVILLTENKPNLPSLTGEVGL